MPNIRVNAYVYGSVQGVFFRAFTRERAIQLGLTGYVRNLEDGRVEIVVEGNDTAIDKLVEQLRKGPPQAEVSKVELQPELFRGEFKSFEVRYL